MKKRIIGFLVITILMAGSTAFANQEAGPADVNNTSALPAAVVMEPRFDFGTVADGAEVVHDFIIQNDGKAPLLIHKVKTVCGCTSVDYARVIPPESTGVVTIKASTSGYGGKVFSKPITVFTNNPTRERITLRITGKVEPFARIEPRYVMLKGVCGEDIQTVVSIRPESEYAFNIVKTWSHNRDKPIECSLEKKDDAWLLTINNRVKAPGKYRDQVHLKTDNPSLPDIVIQVRGVISERKS